MEWSLYRIFIESSRGRAGLRIIGLRFIIAASFGRRGDWNITGRGERPGQRRVVSEGLSVRRVLVPTIMAS